MERTGIVLLNLGGPWSLDRVKPFLRSLFRDRDIIPFPGGPALQGFWSWMLSTFRAPAVRKRYGEIGGGSPLLYWSRVQALGLERRLSGTAPADPTEEEKAAILNFDVDHPGLPEGLSDGPFVTAACMRYSEPGARAALRHLAWKGCRRAVVLPLYPQECMATTGSSLIDLEKAAAGMADAPERVVVRSYHDHPIYLRAMAERVREGLARFDERKRKDLLVLFSAHAVPIRIAESGDPYVAQVKETVIGLAGELAGEIGRHRLAWQSRVGPIEWTGPGTDEVLAELGRQGVRNVLVVPLSFVSDHIETLHEIDIEFAEVAEEAGIGRMERSPALNESPIFLDALCEITKTALAGAPEK
ncbi:MAG: ferrochelatase [Candidatus Eisenbacteria bacterium]